MPRRVEVCPVEDLPPGERKIVEVEGLPHDVGVFNVDGEFHALANVCPHHLAPLCEGEITGEVSASRVGEFDVAREGEIIRCPWHGWQFDITDGSSVFNPHELGARTYEAAVERSSAAGDSRPSAADVDDGRETVDDSPETSDADPEEIEEYGTALKGEEPPIETYDVEVERDVVVVYV